MRRRRGGAHRSSRGAVRLGARATIAVGVLLMVLAVLAPAVGANYARIDASAGCDLAVSWTASASADGSDDERTNVRVQVEYRPLDEDGRAQGSWRSAGPVGEFSPENDFRFSGSFTLDPPVTGAELRVRPLVPWGPGRDGDEPGDPRFAKAEVPESCEDQPLVASQQLDCDAGLVQVTARNVGSDDLVAQVTVDGVTVRDLELAAGGDGLLTVPLLDGRPTRVAVRAGDVVASDQEQEATCDADAPAAVVVERCGGAATQAVVLARGGDAEVLAQVRVDDAVVNRAPIVAGETLQRAIELPDGGAPVEVTLDGSPAAVGEVGGCDGPVAGLLSCGTAGRAACVDESAPPAVDAPPPPPPPLTVELDGATLPRTGPWERALALLLGGALLVGGGLALAGRDRTRPAPSALGEALDPYRQRWWDEPGSGSRRS